MRVEYRFKEEVEWILTLKKVELIAHLTLMNIDGKVMKLAAKDGKKDLQVVYENENQGGAR